MPELTNPTVLPELKAVAIAEKPYVATERVHAVKAFLEADRIVVTIATHQLAANGDVVADRLERIEENPPLDLTLAALMGLGAAAVEPKTK